MSSHRVVVGGPSHSGKSTFTAALEEAIRDKKRGQVYNISFSTMTLDIEDNSLNALRYGEPEKNDVEWNEQNVTQRRDKFESKTAELILADAPGKVTDELEILVEPADEMLLLVNNTKKDKISEWEALAEDSGINILFTLISLPSLSDGSPGWESGDISTGSGKICCISREDVDSRAIRAYDATTRRMIRQIADEILREVP